ncbi:MAG: hypothetical protein PHI06_04695 [Desulfobulbaceae bacterium]|nr:hypothetical protein [Desulfobulbaceae bacterium]
MKSLQMILFWCCRLIKTALSEKNLFTDIVAAQAVPGLHKHVGTAESAYLNQLDSTKMRCDWVATQSVQ